MRDEFREQANEVLQQYKNLDEFELFSNDDCDAVLTFSSVHTRGISLAKANAKVREWLAKGTVVSGPSREDTGGLWEMREMLCGRGHPDDTHLGILVNVRPIDPEDSADKLVKDLAAHGRFAEGGYPLASLNPEYWIERARKLINKQKGEQYE